MNSLMRVICLGVASAWLAAGAIAQQTKSEDGGIKRPLQKLALGPAINKEAGLERPLLQERAQKKAHVLVLGTFHMANPGHDIFNLKVDDVLAPRRQKEIGETVAELKKFRPTKIAIESDPGGK